MSKDCKLKIAFKGGLFIIGGLILAMGLALLFGAFVMLLWNWLMPTIFNLPEITYWQAWGLVLLSHILFKNHNHHRHDHHPHPDWREKLRIRFHAHTRKNGQSDVNNAESGV